MDTNMIITKLNRITKIIILLSLMILLFLSLTSKFDDCSKCSFKIENKNYEANQFFRMYADDCLRDKEIGLGSKFNYTKYP